MPEITIKNKVRLPKDIDLTRELSDIAKKIVIPTIAGHIANRIDITGKKYLPLAESTVKQKQRSGTRKASPEHQLIGEEGKLFSASTYQIFGKKKNSVKIRLKASRRRVAEILQVEGVRSKQFGRRRFNFFGVNDSMEKKAVSFLRRRIKKLF